MATLTYKTYSDGVLKDATSVTLSNAAGTLGIKRNDTGANVVSAGTAFTKTATGTYAYSFTAPATDVFYTAYVKVVADSSTLYQELVFYVGETDTTILVPSAIIAKYVISTLAYFTAPSAQTTWPLYRSALPDGPNVEDNIAAVYDSPGYLQAKDMGGSLTQRYGIQFMLRSTDYDTGYRKLATLLSAFESVHAVNVSIDTRTFSIENVSQSSSITTLGREKDSTKQRYLFSVNLLVTIKEV